MHPGQARTAGTKRLWYSAFSDLDTDEEGNLRSADAGALDTMLQNTVSWTERQSELGFE